MIAIKSQNKHSYLPEQPDIKAHIVRTIMPNGIHMFNTMGGIDIYCEFFALEEDGSLHKIHTSTGNKYEYSAEQVNGMFKSLSDPIYPNEKFLDELQNIATLILLNETNSSAFFGGDTYTIYNGEN